MKIVTGGIMENTNFVCLSFIFSVTLYHSHSECYLRHLCRDAEIFNGFLLLEKNPFYTHDNICLWVSRLRQQFLHDQATTFYTRFRTLDQCTDRQRRMNILITNRAVSIVRMYKVLAQNDYGDFTQRMFRLIAKHDWFEKVELKKTEIENDLKKKIEHSHF